MSDVHVAGATCAMLSVAADLLVRFFREEGFATSPEEVLRNVRGLQADPHHWVGLASLRGSPVGVVTVTTALYVEWGRLGEIGDLYVLPDHRRRGVARALLDAAEVCCAELGCSAVSVLVTDVGEARHGLRAFYAKRGFVAQDRMFLSRPVKRTL